MLKDDLHNNEAKREARKCWKIRGAHTCSKAANQQQYMSTKHPQKPYHPKMLCALGYRAYGYTFILEIADHVVENSSSTTIKIEKIKHSCFETLSEPGQFASYSLPSILCAMLYTQIKQ